MRPIGAPPPNGPVQGPPPVPPATQLPSGTNAFMPASLQPGVAARRPRGMHPAAPAGFWIWRNRRGTWRLRTTSGTGPRSFRGTITGVTAALVRVKTSRPDIADRVRPVPMGITFDLGPSPLLDGLDFDVEDGACVRFQLELDSGTGPATITIGASQQHPSEPTFVLCP